MKGAQNKRLERTRHERASLLSNLGEPLKRSVMHLLDMKIKILLTVTLLIILRTIVSAQNASPTTAGCVLIDSQRRDTLFLTYEKLEAAESSGSSRRGRNVLLRLTNNSTCAVLVETEDAKKFVISQSAAFTPKNIRWDFEDGVVVPELKFYTQDDEHSRSPKSHSGDFFFVFRLPGNRSILFAVPEDYFRECNDIVVPFNFEWERNGSPSLQHRVSFVTRGIPVAVRRRIGTRC